MFSFVSFNEDHENVQTIKFLSAFSSIGEFVYSCECGSVTFLGLHYSVSFHGAEPPCFKEQAPAFAGEEFNLLRTRAGGY